MRQIEIKEVAVIGSGVMGRAIAAHMANANIATILLDIVPQGEKNRNIVAESAVAAMLKTNPAPLTHKAHAKRILCGNLEDDLKKLATCDWIIEAVVENIDIKHDVYKKIDAHRKEGSIVSSNTSTMPLHQLVEPMPKSFKKDFLITHFFNPPRYMHLLELVKGEHTAQHIVDAVESFADIYLGKGIVHCHDTPGFIANRIGCFWLFSALMEALENPIDIEDADAVMSRPIGVPKTGAFGLMDLVGIDLMPLIAKAMLSTLPEKDSFRTLYRELDLVKKMIADGYTGRKGKGGFYRLNTEGGKKTKESIHLADGTYRTAKKSNLESVAAAKEGLYRLVTHTDVGGTYARRVLLDTLSYAASLVPEISDDVLSVDRAMKWGYSWKYGPFELIDKLAYNGKSGAENLCALLSEDGKPVPELLKKVGSGSFYQTDESAATPSYFSIGGKYVPILSRPDAWSLADVTRSAKPVKKGPSSKLWDIGDGIACLQFTSKMNAIDPTTLQMIIDIVDELPKHFRGLVIGNDSDNFCVGANIGFLLFAANLGAWKMISGVIQQGQDAVMGLKYAPFPVVTATSGMTLGGGCEIALHSDAIQAHIETYIGLVEVGVGVIPGWGGCKEMLLRWTQHYAEEASALRKVATMFQALKPVRVLNTMPIVSKAFEMISMAKVAKSAEEARSMNILRSTDRITMNKERLLADAKARCLELSHNYVVPEPPILHLPGKTAKAALSMAVDSFVKKGLATPHDEVISKKLARVLSGGDTDITTEMSEKQLLSLEREVFMELIRTEPTLDRIEHMLETSKPLRN